MSLFPFSLLKWTTCNHSSCFAGYVPIRTPARKLTATPTPMSTTTGFYIQTEDKQTKFVDLQPKGNLPLLKPEDAQYFDKLLVSLFFRRRNAYGEVSFIHID